MTPFTIDRFERALETILSSLPTGSRPAHLCVGLSGGLDSSVLLAALADLGRRDAAKRWTMRALHVDHSLHADSVRWSHASRALAQACDVPFDEVRVDAGAAPGESPEATAREVRYAAFRERLAPGEVLLTAHHADDQLETVLLQWLRGGGLRAIAGMPPLAPLGAQAWHARPLLGFERGALERFARERGLAWVEDPSNVDLRFDRNYLRHAVLPALITRWPAAARTVGRVAEYARDAVSIEAELAAEDLARVRRGRAVRLEALQELPPARQRAALRAWLATLGLPTPAARTLAALQRDVALAAVDRVPRTRWPGAVVHRYRACLHADSDVETTLAPGDWLEPARHPRYGSGADLALELLPGVGVGLSRARLPTRLRVTRRREGEEFLPAGRTHRRPLRKWFQEHDVLPWRRENLPLLRDDADGIVAVADLASAHDYAAEPGEPSLRIVWHGRGIVTESDAFGFKWPGRPPIG
jgi:tRNA(Ile)-lysidine synthase